MHAYIISGGSFDEREKQINILATSWNTNPFDYVRIEENDTSIGIMEIRQFTSRLQLKPQYSPIHVGIILHSELLTISAQQALLKTLEEPPPAAKIILCISNESLLLPTILSRCQRISLKEIPIYTSEDLHACVEKIKAICEASIGTRLLLCQTLGKTKEELSLFLLRAITVLRSNILNQSKPNTSLLHALLQAKKYDDTNISMQMIIEHIFMTENKENIL